jgi:hypothetical protein
MTQPDTNKGRRMLRRYRDVHAFVEVLNTADRRCTKRSDIEFICDLRMRWFHETDAMRLRWPEHVRLIALWWRSRLLQLIDEERLQHAHNVRGRLRQIVEEETA